MFPLGGCQLSDGQVGDSCQVFAATTTALVMERNEWYDSSSGHAGMEGR